MDFVAHLYKITENFPKHEQYGLTSQMRRASISIPSNIAEGSRKSTRKEFANFLRHAYGSGSELETQIELSLRLEYISDLEFKNLFLELTETQKMLNSFIKKL